MRILHAMDDPLAAFRLLQTLAEAWIERPEWRLGQLIAIAVHVSESELDVFYTPDALLFEGLRKLRDDPSRMRIDVRIEPHKEPPPS